MSHHRADHDHAQACDCHSHVACHGEHHGHDWEGEIRAHLGPECVILGVGSRIKGDDAAGPMVAEGLTGKGVADAFDCGGVPENYVAKVEKMNPTDILFVDAVDFGEEPGEIEFFGGESFDHQSISTHSAGLSPLMDFLSCACHARCWVLAIQPQTLDYCAEMSAPVRKAVEQIVASGVWHT